MPPTLPVLLQLDFRATPTPLVRKVAWLTLAVTLGAALWLGREQYKLDGHVEQMQARVQALQRRLSPSKAPLPSAAVNAESQRRMQRANELIDHLTLPWENLFRSVEAADASDLGLLSLAPEPKNQSLRLSGEAKSLPEALAYVDRLAAQPMLHQVHLNAYETVLRDGVNIIQFNLEAQWDRVGETPAIGAAKPDKESRP